jgi:hypothetical protein
MTKRMLVAGLAGGAVLFIWGALAWMVLPLHNRLVHPLPQEETLLPALRDRVTEPGLYHYPALRIEPGMDADQRLAARQNWQRNRAAGPTGILAHRPGPPPAMWQLALQGLLIQIAVALLAGLLLWRALPGADSYGARVQFVTWTGALAAVAAGLPMWNWWGFPAEFIVAMIAERVIGFFLAGLVIGAILTPPA